MEPITSHLELRQISVELGQTAFEAESWAQERSSFRCRLREFGLRLRALPHTLNSWQGNSFPLPAPRRGVIGVSYLDGGRHRHTLAGMVTTHNRNLVRVTLTLDPIDVALLDRLAFHEGLNRSQELRGMLQQFRPMLTQLVSTFDEAAKQRELLDEAMVNATVSELEAIMPEVEEMGRRFMGALAKLEGHAAANAPASNTGATD